MSYWKSFRGTRHCPEISGIGMKPASASCLTQHIFPLKHNQPCQQEADAVHATAAGAVDKLVGRNLRLEDLAPELHVRCEQIGPKVYEEVHAADHVQHYVDS